MTVTDGAKDVLADIGLDRDDTMVVAKCIAQQIIDDSASSDTPLTGVVYAVSGLYNEGTPECEFAASDEQEGIVFSGEFRTETGETTTERRRVASDELRSIVDETPPGQRV